MYMKKFNLNYILNKYKMFYIAKQLSNFSDFSDQSVALLSTKGIFVQYHIISIKIIEFRNVIVRVFHTPPNKLSLSKAACYTFFVPSFPPACVDMGVVYRVSLASFLPSIDIMKLIYVKMVYILVGNKDRPSFVVFEDFGYFSFPVLSDNGRG